MAGMGAPQILPILTGLIRCFAVSMRLKKFLTTDEHR
jgi:hypothetical protein